MKRAAAVVCVAVFASLLSGAASAGLFRAYLSVNGKDTNPCTVQQPCRLLPAALAAVNDGGEVWMLDSANYNTDTVMVTKSVTILAIPGALGSLVAPSGADALQINVGATSVTLRNLIVRLLGDQFATIGIHVLAGINVRIEGCEIYGVETGVLAEIPGASATIVNSAIHDTLVGMEAGGATRASIDNVNLGSNGTAILVDSGAHATVSNSTLTENQTAISAFSGSITGTVVDVARATISATDGTGFEIFASPTFQAEIFVHSTTIHVATGFKFDGAGGSEQIFSYGDNRLVFYTASTSGGSLTPISGI